MEESLEKDTAAGEIRIFRECMHPILIRNFLTF